MNTVLATLKSLPQFMRFTFVGGIGFVADAAVVYLLVQLFGMGPYRVRVLSYLCGSTVTWCFNRILTFVPSRSQPLWQEWLKFVGGSAVGGVVNYLVYASYVHLLDPTPAMLLPGVALGSAAGLCVNYLVARHFVFQTARAV
jgi:putative flippase GtrA